MKYFLRKQELGHANLLDITKEEFDSIVRSRNALQLFSNFTENYRVVLESYKNLEKSMFETQLDYATTLSPSYEVAFESRIALNAALISYLTASRLFHHTSDQLLPRIIGDPSFKVFKDFRFKIYDTQKEYRLIEALRNHVQHKALPIETIKYPTSLDDKKNHETSDIFVTMSLLEWARPTR
jgi:hypothetical protein